MRKMYLFNFVFIYLFISYFLCCFQTWKLFIYSLFCIFFVVFGVCLLARLIRAVLFVAVLFGFTWGFMSDRPRLNQSVDQSCACVQSHTIYQRRIYRKIRRNPTLSGLPSAVSCLYNPPTVNQTQLNTPSRHKLQQQKPQRQQHWQAPRIGRKYTV